MVVAGRRSRGLLAESKLIGGVIGLEVCLPSCVLVSWQGRLTVTTDLIPFNKLR